MAVAALITWLLTAVGGFVMLGIWISKGGARAPRTTHLPPPVIFAHFGLAAAGLVIWIIYLVANTKALAWTAFVLLVPVALLGFFMLARWIPTYRGSRHAVAVGGGTDVQAATTTAAPERHFPVPVVAGHGLLAVTTALLVLLAAIKA
jgi:hypothetical protein